MVLKRSDDTRPTFLVWDSEGQPPDGEWILVLWRGFGESGDAPGHSIPRRVEQHADALRTRFLSWLYDLGEAQIDGKRLADYLVLRPGFSYWWMTLLMEKSSGKSPDLIDALKLLALEDLTAVYSTGTIILASGDKTLAHAFRLWCRNAGLAFEWRRLKKKSDPASLVRRLYRSLPYPVQAVVSLMRTVKQRWTLRRSGNLLRSAAGKEVTFVDYLIHLEPTALATGRYGSNYWSGLVSALDADAVQVNWLHHYVAHELVPKPQRALDLVIRFNENGAGIQSHTILDGALGCSVIGGAVRDYCRVLLVGLRLRKAQQYFRPAGSKIDFWPLFGQDWHKSLFGTTALSNCLFLNLFERTLEQLPRQKLGVYLQENQGWEMAFVHAWKAAGHGRLVGVPHTTVRYWDLRYFFDPRSYERTGKNDLPLPDVVALNGLAAIAAYRQGGFPEDRIVEVEALRYIYLADLRPRRSGAGDLPTGPLRVLVLGDYLPSVTRQQMRWLADASSALPDGTRYIVKPHVSCPVRASDYPSLQLQITGSLLVELLGDCDLVYTSNITSAAVEAYSAGIPVVSVLDGGAFNMSPLRGLPGVTYVTGPSELAHALRHPPGSKGVRPEEYFCLDRKLPRWRHLLGLHEPKFA